jgi:hypothetical protein
MAWITTYDALPKVGDVIKEVEFFDPMQMAFFTFEDGKFVGVSYSASEKGTYKIPEELMYHPDKIKSVDFKHRTLNPINRDGCEESDTQES